MSGPAVRAFRASILHLLADPGDGEAGSALEYFEDGLLVTEDGKVARVGPAEPLLAELVGQDVGQDAGQEGGEAADPGSARVSVTDYRGCLLVPGFIDCHVHYPQIDMIASYGEQLLQWLERYTYPTERRYADRALADRVAGDFLDLMLAHGTTSALIFPTVHAASVDALFEAALARRLRVACGKVLMDRNCPDYLRDTAESGYAESRELLQRWHGRERLEYAITPRFAPTSSPEQLALAGRLAGEFPEVFVHTHLAENRDEVAWVAELFPERSSYLDVYRAAGLLRERAVFAHCLHLQDEDYSLMAEAGGVIAFCPTSNSFMGSGLFDLARARGHGIPVGLGTDVGAGTTLSLLGTAAEAYKVLHLQDQMLSPWQALYLATLGAARALAWDDRIGNFETGKEADFVVLDPAAGTLQRRRTAAAEDLAELVFALLMLGDERCVRATHVLAEPVRPA
ncbi:MAG TPA: guanine deaminase [Woeseiaceae bacterium]|nr:guanine deaminase [Woeseiaceae bacterium]